MTQPSQVTVTSIPELVTEISTRIANKPGLFGIDGWTGVGKTTLAGEIFKAIGCSRLDLDDFLNQDCGCYVDALRLDEVGFQLGNLDDTWIVSGVCLLDVLRRLRIDPLIHIYIKRMASWGWADECELDGTLPEIEGASGIRLREELRAYHSKFRPHLDPDIEFLRPY